MTIVVLVVLAGIWAAVLVPPYLRARSEHSPADSIGSFRRQLNVLQRTSPSAVAPANTLRISSMPRATSAGVPASSRSRAATDLRKARTLKRRRDVFTALLVAMATTLVLGAIPSLRVLWGLHVVLDLAFAGYVVMLVRMRNQAAEREMKLHFLPGAERMSEPALLLRRTGN